MTFDYALHEISYANVLMYCSTLPSYDFDSDKKGKGKGKGGKSDKVFKADDPRNREAVLAIINGKTF